MTTPNGDRVFSGSVATDPNRPMPEAPDTSILGKATDLAAAAGRRLGAGRVAGKSQAIFIAATRSA